MRSSLRNSALLMAVAVSVSAQNSGPACGTSITVTNVYGQNGQFYLFVNDPTLPASKNPIIVQQFTLAASNGQTTFSLRQDQNGNPISIKPGVTYGLTLQTYGFGVCCGAFSNYTLSLSGDLMFTNLSSLPSGASCSSATTCSGFLPPNTTSVNTLSFTVNTSGTSCPVLVDPVPTLIDPMQGNFITQTPSTLSSSGNVVAGVAADGASTLVLRIPANTASDQIFVQVISDQNQPSTSTSEDGGLADISGQTFASSVNSPLTVVQTHSSPNPYLAFALYRAPIDFVRETQPVPCNNISPPCDSAAATRAVYIQVQNGSSSYTFPISIVRPPVVLVHGLTADRTAWDDFLPFLLNPLFGIYISNYGGPVSNVSAISPDYVSAWTGLSLFSSGSVQVIGSELGFRFNAPTVMNDILDAINGYKTSGPPGFSIPVAAVEADIIAHSMGGLVTRMTARSESALFFGPSNYNAGSVHKMITLGTPHLGSPNSLQVLNIANSENLCLSMLLANANILELQSAVVGGIPFDGGTFDLGGDGTGANLSLALQDLQVPAFQPMRIAPLAGTASVSQYNNLNTSLAGLATRALCKLGLPYDPSSIPQNYTSTGWPILMANGLFPGVASDGVVPLTSALMNLPSYTSVSAGPPDSTTALNTFNGVIHSPGVSQEGFGDPYLQEAGAGCSGWPGCSPSQGAAATVQGRVLELLNTSVASPVFQVVP